MCSKKYRNNFSYHIRNRQKTRRKVFFIIFLTVAVLFLLYGINRLFSPADTGQDLTAADVQTVPETPAAENQTAAVIVTDTGSTKEFAELWTEQEHLAIINKAEQILLVDPLAKEALLYGGLANFYQVDLTFDYDEKEALINKTIINLRKAKLLYADYLGWQDGSELYAKIVHILANAYLRKGRYYTDLALFYFNQAVSRGYVDDNSYQHMATLHEGLGEHEKAVEYYKLSIEQKPSAVKWLLLAQVFYNLEEFDQANVTLRKIGNNSEESVIQRKELLMGRISYSAGDFEQAKEHFNALLELSDNYADSHYYLGLIYEEEGNVIKARSEFRKTLTIDPAHFGAKLKYYQ